MVSTRNPRRNKRSDSTAADNAGALADGDFIDHTIDVWQKHTERKLSREDGREIIENMTGFLRILQEWDRAEKAEEAEAKRAAERQRRKTASSDRSEASPSKPSVSYLAEP